MDVYLNEVVRYLTTQSWQIAALAVVVAAATFALRRYSAHVRYLLWLIVLAKCLVPPVYVVPLQVLPPTAPRALPVPLQAWEEFGAPSDVALSIPHAVSRPPAAEFIAFLQDLQVKEGRLSWRGWLGVLWIGGAAVCASMNLLRAWRGRRWVRRNRRALPRDVASDTASLLAPYGVRRLPKIWTMRGISQPFVWGLLRGSIYVPPGFLALESRAHRRDVLAHELSHVLRFDPIVNSLQVFAQILFWFHPLLWWANRKIREEREKCCDEMAIARLQAEPRDYSRALVEALSLQRQSNRFVPSLAIAGPARHIEERIKTMLRPGRQFYRHPSLPATVVAVTLALIAVPTTWALTNRPAGGGQGDDMNAKIAQLQLGVSTRQDAIRVFGKPTQYDWKGKTFQEDNLPPIYEAVFPNAPSIVFGGDVIDEIRFEEQDFGYVFRNKIRIGSSLDDVLAVVAKPRETVVGEPFGWKDGVLYKDGEGQKGYCYYLSAQDHVRMFFRDYKVAALYLTSAEGEQPRPAPTAGNQEGDMNAKIAQLQVGVSTRQDAIRVFGKPTQYLWGDKTFQEESLPKVYIAAFPNGPYIVFQGDVIDEIRFEEQDFGYAFRGKIRIGSSLDDVLAVLAKPRETVVGEPFGWKDGVLYKDGEGEKGFCYYLSSQDHVRMFFKDYKVAVLYLTNEGGSGGSPQRAQAKKTLAAFDDCRGMDLSQLDLSDKKGVLTTLWLNQDVKWPGKDKMPADFRPDDLLKSAMNPGLGVRQLHARGITGKGVSVGIIDQPLRPDHPEFAGKIAAYHDVGTNKEMSMHGPAVASLLVGTQCGTAPGASLYFAAAPSWTEDAAYKAKALDWLVEQNKALPAGRKIRVISVSAAPSQASWKNHEMWGEACKRAEAEGILVLDCSHERGFIGPCWIDANDPENVAKCRPGFLGKPMERGSSPNEILTPTSLRTTAEGRSTYQYTGQGGLSWAIPYTAGVLAMGWQVRPDLPAEKMKDLLLASGREVANGHRIIDPQNFIRQVQAAK